MHIYTVLKQVSFDFQDIDGETSNQAFMDVFETEFADSEVLVQSNLSDNCLVIYKWEVYVHIGI